MNTTQAPDPLTAAALAELGAIQRRLDQTWDLAAGLREILLEEPYHRYVEEQGAAFDVEAGLAAIVGTDGDVPDGWLALRYDDDRLCDSLGTTDERCRTLLARRQQDNVTTFERIRRLAGEVREEIDAVVDEGTPDHWRSIWLVHSLTGAEIAALSLHHLADDLESSGVDLEEALAVVADTARRIGDLNEALETAWREREGSGDHPRRLRLAQLRGEVTDLRGSIKRLFDLSDETVGALL
ncbi:hypothetical protein ABZU25_10755 [Micromonospora sp. NPDC005215]|uniref:hypothetical protein n=1 Tax=Micromonospora sp. NPDC005215 TaxID=3157024 RepID=UPI0033A36628